MRVLMLGWELPPHYVGGLGIVCDQLTRQMSRDGHDLEFILPFKADYSHIRHMKVRSATDVAAKDFMAGGGTYDSAYYTSLVSAGQIIKGSLHHQVHAFASAVGRLVKYGEYDVIHAHDWLTFRAGLEAKRVTGLPLFVHIHATEFDRAGGQPGNPLVREIEYLGLHLADHVFTVSQRTKDTIIREYDVPADKITVASNAMEISPDLIQEQPDTYPLLEKLRAAGYQVVLNAGRMTVQKGIYHLLQAARLVVDKHPRTLFLLAGGGDQIPDLIEETAALGLSANVLFTGRIEGIGKEWRDSFRMADLFVMPSVSEPAGLTPYEAIAYGTPTLISKQAGVSETLKSSLKVDHWDIQEMASQICGVLEHHDLHDELVASAQREARSHTWQPVAAKMYDRYRAVLMRYGRQPEGALA